MSVVSNKLLTPKNDMETSNNHSDKNKIRTLTEQQKKLVAEKCNSMKLDKLVDLVVAGAITLEELPKLDYARKTEIEKKLNNMPNDGEQTDWLAMADIFRKECETLKQENKDLEDKNKKVRKKKNRIITVVIIIIVVLTSILSILLIFYKMDFEYYSKESTELNNLVNDLNDQLHDISSSIPMLITDIEIANIYEGGGVQSDYGSDIYSDKARFLKPRITYTRIRQMLISEYVNLNVKFYSESDNVSTLLTNWNSPDGYTYSINVSIENGRGRIMELPSWGYGERSVFSPGKYRIEIWHDNVCLRSKSFKIFESPFPYTNDSFSER